MAEYAMKRLGTRCESSPCNFVLETGFNCPALAVRMVKKGRLWLAYCEEHG